MLRKILMKYDDQTEQNKRLQQLLEIVKKGHIGCRKRKKKLSKEFSRTGSQILGAFSKLDENFLNPQVRVQPATIPETARNRNIESLELTGDRYYNDRHPEVDVSVYQSAQTMVSDPEYTTYKVKQA